MTMQYLKVTWIHDYDDEPTLLYSEIDENRNESRKIEFYKDNSFGLASLNMEFGGTLLSEGPIPSIEEIKLDPQFFPVIISKEEFETTWIECINFLSSLK